MAAIGTQWYEYDFGVNSNLGGHPLTSCQAQRGMNGTPLLPTRGGLNLGSDTRESTLVKAQGKKSRWLPLD